MNAARHCFSFVLQNRTLHMRIFYNHKCTLRSVVFVRKRWCGLRNNFGKCSEIFGKWSEILYIIKNITRQLEDMNLMFSWQEQYLMSKRSERVKSCSCHSNIKFISFHHRVISSIYVTSVLPAAWNYRPVVFSRQPHLEESTMEKQFVEACSNIQIQ